MHHYPFHPGDYMLDTAHLEPMHDLCYRRALDLYYVSEPALPDDKQLLSKRLRVAEQVLAEILTEFFTLTEKGWEQAKCEHVLTKYHATSKARKEAGSLGGAKKSKQKRSKSKQLLSNSQANASNQKPETNNQKPFSLAAVAAESVTQDSELGSISEKKKGAAALEIYAAYPRKVARDAALKAIEKRLDQGVDAQELLDATHAFAIATEAWEVGDRQYIPHPATWFNAGSFADDQREWNRGGAPAAKKEKALPVEEEPAGWWDAWALCWPEVECPKGWHGIPESYKTELRIKLEDMTR